ncbi:MAG: patatin family protein [bacterium]|nr:patatin family protein [bacterium]
MICSSHATDTIGLALAGGGPQGSVYELGALRALDEALDGIDFNRIPVYVGVSAGAFIAACLANGLQSDQLCRAIIKHDPGEHPFSPATFLRPALGRIVRSGLKVPRLLGEAVWEAATIPSERRLLSSLMRLGRALPVGIFDNEPMRAYLAKVLSRPGRTDDFRELSSKLFVIATDLDSGQAIRFGDVGFDHVPISTAVQASSALPGLYPPVEIDGRSFVDGVLLKTVHASVALEQDIDLLLCINPIVPVDTAQTVEQGVMKRGRLVDRGLPTVMSQTLRTIIHSRMGAGLAAYETRYKDKDVLVFEPSPEDYGMFFTNVFSFAKRKAVCEHAYKTIRSKLWKNRDRICPILERHGVQLREEMLTDEDRTVWQSVELHKKRRRSILPLTAKLERALTSVEVLVDNAQGALGE